jgi:hypothetical protein
MTLIIGLLSLVLLSALGTSLVIVVGTELRAAANYTTSREAMYAADGALEIAVHELLAVADWNAVLSNGALSAFVDGPASGSRQLGDGTAVDLVQATAAANGETRPWGANNPVWRPFAFGWLGPTTYVMAWVGDDPAENDGDPSTDGGGPANPGAGILAVRAEAFGAGGAHRVLEATLRKDTAGPAGPMVQVLSWQEIR